MRFVSPAFPAVLVLAAALAPLPGKAQTLPSTRGITPPIHYDDGKPKDTHQAPPPALPGSQAIPRGAAPSAKTNLDLSPNDALFDAINRGDVTAARDAINRGADVSSHNVLGMTPLELSVDLNRNDISFLLLSYRSDDSYSHPKPPPGHGADHPAAAQPDAANAPHTDKKAAGKKEAKADRKRSARAAKHMPAQQAAAPKSGTAASKSGTAASKSGTAAPAHMAASDGGHADPKAGFLGFDKTP